MLPRLVLHVVGGRQVLEVVNRLVVQVVSRIPLVVGGEGVARQYWVQGDTTPLQLQIKYQDNTVVNLTGASGKFYMRRQGATANTVNGSAVTITTPASGYCEYRWLAADIATAGTFDCEVEFTDSAGYLLTTEPVQPLVLVVRKGLG